MNRCIRFIIAASIAAASQHALARPSPLSTAFTYQGVLKSGGNAYSGTADFQFRLYDAASGPTQIGGMVSVSGLTVVEGTFTTSLDFGALAFNGDNRWLEIDVRTPAGGPGSFVTLTPRQKLAAAPYALRALSATVSGLQPNAVDFNNAGNAFAGSGAGLAGLNAANIATGNLSASRMPTGGTWNLTSATSITGQTLGNMVTITNTEDDPSSGLSVTSNANSGFAIAASATGASAAALAASNSHATGIGLLVNASRSIFLGRVGVGTGNPATPVHVQIGSAGVAPIGNTTLALESSANHYLSLIAPDANESGVLFANPGSGVAGGGIIYNNGGTPNGLQFRTGGNNTRATIDNAGRMLLTSAQSGPSLLGLYNVSDQPSGTTLSTFYRTWFVGQNRPAENPGVLDAFYIRDSDAGATRLLITTGGDVGIGTLSPAAKLDVNGTVKASALQVPATTRYLSIPFSAFMPERSNMTHACAAVFLHATTMNQDVRFIAPVMLPHGATITRMDVDVVDNTNNGNFLAELRCWLYPSTHQGELMAQALSSGVDGFVQRLSDSTIYLPVVDNFERMYYLEVSWKVPNSVITDDARLYRGLITYTVTDPVP